jgi:nicotinamidase-related amidase
VLSTERRRGVPVSKLSVYLLVIDPQKDFMDDPDSALPVPGANEDMRRCAAMINRVGRRIRDIYATLDSHHVIDVGHPSMWENADGVMPAPFTIIPPSDIEDGVWAPRRPNAKPSQLGGKTLQEYMVGYARRLETNGNYPLMVWPEHCVIGTPGHTVQSDLMVAIHQWERDHFANAGFVTKGTNTFTEHYGALMAEVPMASDPSSGLNTELLEVLADADIVAIAGEALSHCVKSTVTQIADNIGGEHVKKFHILTDCSSPVPKVGDGPDFPAIAEEWLKEMERRGMTLTTSTEFLA